MRRFCLITPAVVVVISLAQSARGGEKPIAPGTMSVRKLAAAGPWEIVEGDRPVLRYNYQIVPEPDAVKPRITPANQKHAVPRSDYIHPLYGLHGEVLTDDWVPDHPHHRGIYWAWPEVDWQGKRGDLHALQQVFARPTGKIQATEGKDFAQIEAENEWRWDDQTPIVHEAAIVRAWQRIAAGQAIDLEFHFTALGSDVQVARRGTKFYGGLNVRLSPLADQKITPWIDPPTATPRTAWAHRSGTPRGASQPVALTILQDSRNPDYPGDWVQFPEISWIQPTFPAAGTRFTITKDRPLVLRYRLWIHDRPLEAEAIRKLRTK